MPVFEYNALNNKGKKISGIIDAESLISAGTKIRKKNFFPISINEIDSESKTEKKNNNMFNSLNILLFSRIKASEIAMITRQLATLISAGFPLVEAIATLVTQTRSKALKKILSKIKGSIEEGRSFAESLLMYPSVFSQIYINMIKAGESSGTLEIVLERLADITEKREETKQKIQTAFAYPVFMAVIGCLVLIFLITYIIPGIVSIFSDMNQTLPAPTRFLISLSSFLNSFWWGVIFIPVIGLISIHLFRRTDKGAYIFDKILFFIPKIGKLLQKLAAARFSRVLSALLENGVPMLTSLSIAKGITGNKIIIKAIDNASQVVEQGGELGKALEASNAFPFLAIQMIKVGEKSGKMEDMLKKTAELFEKEVEASVTSMTALLEPFIILVMGILVGFIVLSICLPIFGMNQLVM